MAWTNNAMEVGVATANPDIVDANLTYLKEQADAVPDLINPDIISLGNKSSDFTLTIDREHEASITDSCEMLKPSVSSSNKHRFCYIEFNLSSGKSLTINGVKWDENIVRSLSTTNLNRIMLTYKSSEGFWRGAYKMGGS